MAFLKKPYTRAELLSALTELVDETNHDPSELSKTLMSIPDADLVTTP